MDLGSAEETMTKENIENVFHMGSVIEYREEIQGISVFLLGKIK